MTVCPEIIHLALDKGKKKKKKLNNLFLDSASKAGAGSSGHEGPHSSQTPGDSGSQGHCATGSWGTRCCGQAGQGRAASSAPLSSRCDAARWARGQLARGGFQKEPLGQGVKLLGKRKATVSGSSRAPGRKP